MSASSGTVTVLAILPSGEDQTSLGEIFSHSKWALRVAEDMRDARTLIDDVSPGVVISDCDLPDGRWQDVLRELQCRPLEPVLIVASRLADDRLWGEVLNLGGYDVLATPLQDREVIRSVRLAWRHWRDKLATREKSSGKVMTVHSPI